MATDSLQKIARNSTRKGGKDQFLLANPIIDLRHMEEIEEKMKTCEENIAPSSCQVSEWWGRVQIQISPPADYKGGENGESWEAEP